MKKLLFILPLLILVACEEDFDELKDTDQRSVTFSFITDGFLSEILMPDGDGYAFAKDTVLDYQHRLRIVTFCYNRQGTLLHKDTRFSSLNQSCGTTIRHLHKDSTYRFVFIADIVEYSSSTNYLERWFALDAYSVTNLYITSLEQDDIAKYNAVKMDTMTIMPSNQTLEVPFFPITYNGYCKFVNATNVDKVSGYVSRYLSFRVSSLSGITKGTNKYAFYPSQQADFVFPITATMADDEYILRIITETISGSDTTNYRIRNVSHLPFVVTVDCQNRSIVDCQYFKK